MNFRFGKKMRENFLHSGILKGVLLLCFMCVLKVTPAAAQKLSLTFQNATMEQVLEELKSKTSYDVLYNFEEIAKIPSVTKVFKDASVEEILQYCLKNTNYTYNIVNNIIVIKLKEANDKKDVKVKERTVRGVVMDERGEPLPGATVMLKGTKMGVATDANGVFKVTFVPMDSTVFVVSFVGMVTKEVVVSNDTKNDDKPLSIRLAEEKMEMEEVVITGYGNINKKSFTGNSIKVDREELLKVSKNNVLAALQTFDPSFRIQENTEWGSDPNAVPELYIRGRSGIGVKELDADALSKSNLKNNPNLPLFIMDGFEISVTKLYDMDINRIENITLLKDAAATAMYGSRAANGVVVITTVAPTPGKLSVSYSMTGTVTMPDLSDYNLMNAKEKLATELAAGIYQSDKPMEQYILDSEYNKKLDNVVRGVDTYWLSKPLHTAFNHKHSLYVDGGTNDIRFGVDLGYNNEDGVMKDSYRDRISMGLYLDYRIKSFQVKNYISYGVTRSADSPYGTFSDYTTKLPYDEYKNADGTYKRALESWHMSTDQTNPLYEAGLKSFNRTEYHELINNLSANWYINDYLQVKGQFTVTKTSNKTRNFIDPLSKKNTDELDVSNAVAGELTVSTSESLGWDMNVVLAYNRSIEKHNMNFSLGINATSSSSESVSTQYRGFPSGDFSSPSYAQDVYEKPSNGDDKSRLFGFLGMLNYSYNNIYLLDASLRVDGSSKFGTDNKTGLFWSLGAGIALHNYDFVKNIGFIDELKLRGTYGATGKVNFEPYAAKTVYNIDGLEWYETGMGASMVAMGNKNLGWETTYTTDLGVDIGFLDRLFYVTASWYNKKTVDLVNDVTIPSSTGFTTYKDNVGEMQNRGFEVSVRSNIFRSRDINFSIFANLAHNENKILKISSTLRDYNARVDAMYEELGKYKTEATKPLKKFEEGASTTAISVVKSHGIDPATGNEILEKRDGTLTTVWDSADQISYGDTEPDIQGSFGFNFRYKQLSLYATFMYEYGGQRYNQTLVNKVENADVYNDNVDKRVLSQRWKQPGDNAKFKKLESGKNSIVMTRASTRFVEDYNLLTLNSVTLGYDFPQRWLKKAGLSMVRFELGANDLARFCTVKQERGLSYPYARTMNFSLKATF